jgi:hypothetical protein
MDRHTVKANVEEDRTGSRLTNVEKEGVERSKECGNGGRLIMEQGALIIVNSEQPTPCKPSLKRREKSPASNKRKPVGRARLQRRLDAEVATFRCTLPWSMVFDSL